jgi:hypothetical protein
MPLRHKSSNFLTRSLKAGIIGVHPMQVVIKKNHLKLVLAQCLERCVSILGKDRRGQALPKPRDAIFRVLNNENGPVCRYVKLLAHLRLSYLIALANVFFCLISIFVSVSCASAFRTFARVVAERAARTRILHFGGGISGPNRGNTE